MTIKARDTFTFDLPICHSNHVVHDFVLHETRVFLTCLMRRETPRPLWQSRHVTGQNALKFLLHPLHLFEVQCDGLRDICNLDIPHKCELQSLETFVAVIIRIGETGYGKHVSGEYRLTTLL